MTSPSTLKSTGPPWVLNGTPSVRTPVVSWSDSLEAMDQAGGPAAHDIQQLAAAARALRAPVIQAFDVDDLRGGWTERRDDLCTLIDVVTRGATAELQTRGFNAPDLPWQPNPSGGLAGGFRYLAEPDQPNLVVGIATPKIHQETLTTSVEQTPLWIRLAPQNHRRQPRPGTTAPEQHDDLP